ncbi:TMV resistance protein N-like [Pistacia vera]|uniref:TMV resistance protein N-like n=1 Tax=Pistacia vera TaxID=55513 RepID=UPI001263C554|nr:TMV resistance protein N-like [Pistacia vera]
MAVASSSASPQEKYDVFLSFRGADTRYNFTSHLYAALCQKQINAFMDDEELERGEQISPSLLNAIEQSKISLIIFSQGYASSRWCLEELEKILECMDKYGQIVMPVFHNIDPSDARSQNGTFGDAFAKHEERFKGRQEMLQRWRAALKKAADLSGFDSNVIRSEFELVQEVVKAVLMRLNNASPLIDENLVGVDSRIKDIEGLLRIGFAGVRKIGIWGAGGIGKTTLARAIFNKISENRHFESSYFFENIREESEKNKGLTGLQQQIICKILGDKNANIGSPSTIRRLGRVKVFIVLDDVTNLKQIESLIGDFKYLGLGSRIIITTRDKQVLENCHMDGIYETKILSDDAALQLFSRHAFRQERPPKDFRKLAGRVLSYANGVPLALKVLGSFLFKRTKKKWESQLVNLNINDHRDIQEVLKVSHNYIGQHHHNA